MIQGSCEGATGYLGLKLPATHCPAPPKVWTWALQSEKPLHLRGRNRKLQARASRLPLTRLAHSSGSASPWQHRGRAHLTGASHSAKNQEKVLSAAPAAPTAQVVMQKDPAPLQEFTQVLGDRARSRCRLSTEEQVAPSVFNIALSSIFLTFSKFRTNKKTTR